MLRAAALRPRELEDEFPRVRELSARAAVTVALCEAAEDFATLLPVALAALGVRDCPARRPVATNAGKAKVSVRELDREARITESAAKTYKIVDDDAAVDGARGRETYVTSM